MAKAERCFLMYASACSGRAKALPRRPPLGQPPTSSRRRTKPSRFLSRSAPVSASRSLATTTSSGRAAGAARAGAAASAAARMIVVFTAANSRQKRGRARGLHAAEDLGLGERAGVEQQLVLLAQVRVQQVGAVGV